MIQLKRDAHAQVDSPTARRLRTVGRGLRRFFFALHRPPLSEFGDGPRVFKESRAGGISQFIMPSKRNLKGGSGATSPRSERGRKGQVDAPEPGAAATAAKPNTRSSSKNRVSESTEISEDRSHSSGPKSQLTGTGEGSANSTNNSEVPFMSVTASPICVGRYSGESGAGLDVEVSPTPSSMGGSLILSPSIYGIPSEAAQGQGTMMYDEAGKCLLDTVASELRDLCDTIDLFHTKVITDQAEILKGVFIQRKWMRMFREAILDVKDVIVEASQTVQEMQKSETSNAAIANELVRCKERNVALATELQTHKDGCKEITSDLLGLKTTFDYTQRNLKKCEEENAGIKQLLRQSDEEKAQITKELTTSRLQTGKVQDELKTCKEELKRNEDFVGQLRSDLDKREEEIARTKNPLHQSEEAEKFDVPHIQSGMVPKTDLTISAYTYPGTNKTTGRGRQPSKPWNGRVLLVLFGVLFVFGWFQCMSQAAQLDGLQTSNSLLKSQLEAFQNQSETKHTNNTCLNLSYNLKEVEKDPKAKTSASLPVEVVALLEELRTELKNLRGSLEAGRTKDASHAETPKDLFDALKKHQDEIAEAALKFWRVRTDNAVLFMQAGNSYAVNDKFVRMLLEIKQPFASIQPAVPEQPNCSSNHTLEARPDHGIAWILALLFFCMFCVALLDRNRALEGAKVSVKEAVAKATAEADARVTAGALAATAEAAAKDEAIKTSAERIRALEADATLSATAIEKLNTELEKTKADSLKGADTRIRETAEDLKKAQAAHEAEKTRADAADKKADEITAKLNEMTTDRDQTAAKLTEAEAKSVKAGKEAEEVAKVLDAEKKAHAATTTKLTVTETMLAEKEKELDTAKATPVAKEDPDLRDNLNAALARETALKEKITELEDVNRLDCSKRLDAENALKRLMAEQAAGAAEGRRREIAQFGQTTPPAPDQRREIAQSGQTNPPAPYQQRSQQRSSSVIVPRGEEDVISITDLS